MEQVKSHSEKFDFNILKIRELKNKEIVDSAEKNEVEFITGDEALDLYNDDEFLIVDQNSRKLSQEKKTPTEVKNTKKSKRERELNKNVYLPLDLQEYVSQFGKNNRKNAGVGSGIVELIKMFIPMKKRNDHQVKRIVLLLNQLDLATNEIARHKMKGSNEQFVEEFEKNRMGLSLDVVYHMNLFGFTEKEMNRFLNETQKMLLSNALDKYEIYKMEKNLEELGSLRGLTYEK